MQSVNLNDITIANNAPLVLMAGPCVMESRDLVYEVAGRLHEMTRSLGVPLIFKASFDKANRTSVSGARGLGMEKGLALFEDLKRDYGFPVITDVHEPHQCQTVASVVDVLQIPAFLCRQTDLIQAAAETSAVLHIKKGQFMAPWDMKAVLEKARSFGATRVLLCERGACFGYNALVSDLRSLPEMQSLGVPVTFDGTHSVQQPGGLGSASGGKRQFVETLVRAAVSVGVAGLFLETHPHPDQALSDGPNMVPLGDMEALLHTIKAFDALAKQTPYAPFSAQRSF